MKKLPFIPFFLLLLTVSCNNDLLTDNQPEDHLSVNNEEIAQNKRQPSISLEEALKIIKPVADKYPGRWVDISAEIIPANSEIAYSDYGQSTYDENAPTVKSPAYDSWLAVVGPDPCINGVQELLHIFIDANSGKISETWIDGRAIVEWDTSRYNYVDSGIDNYSLKKKRLPGVMERSSSPSKWAVILSGGVDKFSNYERYWNDCQYIYITLTQTLGYPSDHIICLVADGIAPAHDRRIGVNTFDSSPVDFDGDGVRDIEYPARKNELSTVFSYLGTVVSAGDEVVLFVTDHGSSEGNIMLWDEESLTPTELDHELSKLGQSVAIDIVLGQCYSGKTALAINRKNRTVTAAAESLSYGTVNFDGHDYDYFLKHWTDAIVNMNPSVSGTFSNGDGRLSLSEIYKYAKYYNPKSSEEKPKYLATPTVRYWGHDLSGNTIIPYISGGEYVSNNHTTSYTLHDLPASFANTWRCSNGMYVASSNGRSVNISGNLPYSQYVSLDESVYASFMDLGEMWTVTKDVTSVWRPGSYIGNNFIIGSNTGDYFLIHYPLVGTYQGTSRYMWESSHSSWQILQQDGARIFVQRNPVSSPVTLSVMFTDPFSDIIYISDQVL